MENIFKQISKFVSKHENLMGINTEISYLQKNPNKNYKNILRLNIRKNDLLNYLENVLPVIKNKIYKQLKNITNSHKLNNLISQMRTINNRYLSFDRDCVFHKSLCDGQYPLRNEIFEKQFLSKKFISEKCVLTKNKVAIIENIQPVSHNHKYDYETFQFMGYEDFQDKYGTKIGKIKWQNTIESNNICVSQNNHVSEISLDKYNNKIIEINFDNFILEISKHMLKSKSGERDKKFYESKIFDLLNHTIWENINKKTIRILFDLGYIHYFLEYNTLFSIWFNFGTNRNIIKLIKKNILKCSVHDKKNKDKYQSNITDLLNTDIWEKYFFRINDLYRAEILKFILDSFNEYKKTKFMIFYHSKINYYFEEYAEHIAETCHDDFYANDLKNSIQYSDKKIFHKLLDNIDHPNIVYSLKDNFVLTLISMFHNDHFEREHLLLIIRKMAEKNIFTDSMRNFMVKIQEDNFAGITVFEKLVKYPQSCVKDIIKILLENNFLFLINDLLRTDIHLPEITELFVVRYKELNPNISRIIERNKNIKHRLDTLDISPQNHFFVSAHGSTLNEYFIVPSNIYIKFMTNIGNYNYMPSREDYQTRDKMLHDLGQVSYYMPGNILIDLDLSWDLIFHDESWSFSGILEHSINMLDKYSDPSYRYRIDADGSFYALRHHKGKPIKFDYHSPFNEEQQFKSVSSTLSEQIDWFIKQPNYERSKTYLFEIISCRVCSFDIIKNEISKCKIIKQLQRNIFKNFVDVNSDDELSIYSQTFKKPLSSPMKRQESFSAQSEDDLNTFMDDVIDLSENMIFVINNSKHIYFRNFDKKKYHRYITKNVNEFLLNSAKTMKFNQTGQEIQEYDENSLFLIDFDEKMTLCKFYMIFHNLNLVRRKIGEVSQNYRRYINMFINENSRCIKTSQSQCESDTNCRWVSGKLYKRKIEDERYRPFCVPNSLNKYSYFSHVSQNRDSEELKNHIDKSFVIPKIKCYMETLEEVTQDNLNHIRNILDDTDYFKNVRFIPDITI